MSSYSQIKHFKSRRHYPGKQPAIIDQKLWDRAQDQLKANLQAPMRRPRATEQSLLMGLLHDDKGTHRVSQLVAMHAGRATTPHLFRDIVADDWLEHHPEDYLTVSKILWHRNIETTLTKYASRFDESAGVARMDDWRASRRKAVA